MLTPNDTLNLMLSNYKIYENKLLTISGPEQTIEHDVRLSWKERLFSWPWKPLVKTRHYIKTFQTQLPDPNYYILGDRIILGHPETIMKLKEALKKHNMEC